MLLNKNIGNFLPVQAGRGCPKTCSFCSVYCLYKGQYLKRDIQEVIRDIKRIKELNYELEEAKDNTECLMEIARQRRCYAKGDTLDYSKAAALLMDDFRSGKLGRITLEFPE